MKVSAIIPAAGVGKRFGEKKQFKLLNGQSLLIHAIKPFIASDLVSEIVIVVPYEEIDKFQDELGNILYSKSIILVPGGNRRQDSVKNGVIASSNLTELVCIHDAVRPFISYKLIKKCIEACHQVDGSILATQSIDTVKYSENGEINHTLERKNIWLAQTPQVFWKDKLIKAMNNINLKVTNVTDEAYVMEKMGYKIVLVKGDRDNFKITTPNDWKLAKNLIK